MQQHNDQQRHRGEFWEIQRLCAQPARLRDRRCDRECVQEWGEASTKRSRDGLGLQNCAREKLSANFRLRYLQRIEIIGFIP